MEQLKREQAARWQIARHTSFSVAFLVAFHTIRNLLAKKDSSGKAARYEIPGVRSVNIGPKSEAKHARRLWLLQMSIHVTP